VLDQLQLAEATLALIVHEAIPERGVRSKRGSDLVLEATRVQITSSSSIRTSTWS
jgi:hypothetical protein